MEQKLIKFKTSEILEETISIFCNMSQDEKNLFIFSQITLVMNDIGYSDELILEIISEQKRRGLGQIKGKQKNELM